MGGLNKQYNEMNMKLQGCWFSVVLAVSIAILHRKASYTVIQ